MVTTLKSNAARNTAASITASAYQRRELMGMTCRRAGSVPVGATLLTPGLHLCRCRLPRNSARPSAPDARGLFRPPVSERAADSVSMTTRALVVSDQARRYLTLAYGSPTEFMGCMIGQVHGPVVFVQRIAPADVDPAHSTRTHVLPRQTCEEAGWTGTVGMIHSHPGGERCFYYFPGTQVASSDAESFARQPYPVDAIMCGDSIVWIGRDRAQRQLRLAD